MKKILEITEKIKELIPRSRKNSRRIKAALCFTIAGVVTLSIFATNIVWKQTEAIIKPSHTIASGSLIKESDVSIIEVAKGDVPKGAITNKKDVAGKYAKSDIYKDDVITEEKITSLSSDYFATISSDKRIMSFTVKTLSSSVASNIKTGDRIQVMYGSQDPENGQEIVPVMPENLTNLRVIDIKNIDAEDKKSDKVFVPYSVTVLVTEEQAMELYKAETAGNIHILFAKR